MRLGSEGFECGRARVVAAFSGTSGELTTARPRFGNAVIGIAIFPSPGENNCLQEALPRSRKQAEDGLKFPLVSMQQNRLEEWSLLTIFLVGNAPLWLNEGKTEGSLGGSLPHVWCEAGRKVRA